MGAILDIVKDSGHFDAEGLAYVRGTLEQHLAGNDDGIWLTANDGEPVGVAYCAPEPVAAGTWNLLMLWTNAGRHRAGHGTSLVEEVERQLNERQARLLVVETSSLPGFAPARSFYSRCGFTHEATVNDFFAEGDAKLIFTKRFPALDLHNAGGPRFGRLLFQDLSIMPATPYGSRLRAVAPLI